MVLVYKGHIAASLYSRVIYPSSSLTSTLEHFSYSYTDSIIESYMTIFRSTHHQELTIMGADITEMENRQQRIDISTPEAPIFTVETFDAASLRAQSWLPELTFMINDSFIQHAKNLLPPLGSRLDTDTQLADEILKGGLTGVGFLEEMVEGVGRIKKVVTTATAKPWIEEWPWEEILDSGSPPCVKRKILKGDGKCERDVLQWEMTAVVNRYEERYLGKGYAAKVMKVLEADLIRRLGDLEIDGTPKSMIEKRVWMIRNAEELTGEYWLNRGYKTIGGMWFEKGMLGCYRRFRLNHMIKDFEFGNVG